MMNPKIPDFFKNREIKRGGEEDNQPISLNININDMNNNPENTKTRMQFLFPKIPKEEINNVLERTGYNIEKAVILIKELKEQKNKTNGLENKKGKIVQKRNYNSVIEKESNILKNKEVKPDNISINNKQNIPLNSSNNIISTNTYKNTNDNNINNLNIQTKYKNENSNIINNNNTNNPNRINDISTQQENKINPVQETHLNPNNNNINTEKTDIAEDNSINNAEKPEENEDSNNIILDEEKKNKINQQINYLLDKFARMNDISQLKSLLKEIGFPEKEENKDKEKEENDKNKLIEIIKEKIENNEKERKYIISQYTKYNGISKLIKQKEDKIDELTSSLGNLIEKESEQKMREEDYKNELKEYSNIYKNNYNNFNDPREGY